MRRPASLALAVALLCPLAAARAQEGGAAPADPPPAEPAPAFRILFDGQTGGLSSGRMEMGFGDLLFAYLESTGGTIREVRSGLGTLYRGGRYLWTDDGLLSSAVAFVAAGEFEVVEQIQPAPLVVTDRAVLLQGAHDPDLDLLDTIQAAMLERGDPPDAQRMQGILTRVRNGAGDEAWLAQGPGTPSEPELATDPHAWEVRAHESVSLDAAGHARTLHQLARMTGEGSRRKRLIEDRLAASRCPAIYVSAGGAVEGRSFVSNQPLSLQRPHSWAALDQTGLRFLAPGGLELTAGLDGLIAESGEAGVTLLSANLHGPSGAMPFEGAELVELGSVAVAFVGVTDPAVLERLDEGARAGLQLDPPQQAVERALHALRARHDRDPDLVVLLASFSPASSGELLRELSGVDVVIGDFRAAQPQPVDLDVALVQPDRARRADRRPALVVHASGSEVGELEGWLGDDGTLDGLRLRTHPISQLLPIDDEALRPVMGVRQQVWLAGEPVLVPDLRTLAEEDINRVQFLMEGQPYRQLVEQELAAGTLAAERLLLQMTPELWGNLTANLLRERARADVVILPPLPWPFELSGPTRELYAAAYLSVPDQLQLYELTGSQLRELVRVTGDARDEGRPPRRHSAAQGDASAEARTGAPWIAGLDPTHALVGGRPLSTSDTYRVVTTTALQGYPTAGQVLAGTRPRQTFRADERRLIPTPLGAPRTLREEVLAGLEQMRAEHPELGPAYRAHLAELLHDRGETVYPLFYLRADHLGVVLTRYVVQGDQEAYANVRESRVTTPTSFTFGLRAGGALGVDTRDIVLEAAGQAVLTVNTVGEAEPSELEDDLVFKLDAGLKGLSVRAVPIYPYVQASYDTEFMRTRELDEAGDVAGLLPRQKDLRGTGGVTATNLIPSFRSIKAGTFVEYDFSAEEGPLESGMSLEIQQELARTPVRWANTFKLDGWFPTDFDTDEDLLITANLRTELGVSLLRNLAFKTYADLLGYRGKVEATETPGLSAIFGIELAFTGAFETRIGR